MARIVKAVYDSQYAAKRAVDELSSYGFERDFMHIQAVRQFSLRGNKENHPKSETIRLKSEVFVDEVKAGGLIGAGIASAIGLTSGMLIAFGALAPGWLPVTGPSNIMLILIAGVVIGAVIGFIFGRLLGGSIGFGFPESEAEQYARNVCPSSIRVSVFADRATVDSALDILNKFNPLEIQEEIVSSVKPGWIEARRGA